ncbi:MAG: hypothetical protein MK160_14030 [Rhodobacteraceae bacterium]|nr:hypothetical protein [Paracoccaceae bacterium]
MVRILVLLSLMVGLAACGNGAKDLEKPLEPLGDMKLGFAVVVAPDPVKGPLSRDANPDEWVAAMQKQVDLRFQRYQGEKFYNIGISVDGYVLAQPGIPIVLSPKSVLIIKATVWDDAAGTKLNDEAEQITVLEAVNPETAILGSGLTQSKAKQMENLSINAAFQVERWMRRMQAEKGWFGGEAAVETDADTTVSQTAAEAG